MEIVALQIWKIAQVVKFKLLDVEAGHDWLHVQRVWSNAMKIAKSEEEADLSVVQLGVLLHDIADAKFYSGDENIGPDTARSIMMAHKIPSDIIEAVIHIVKNIGYKESISGSKIFRSKALDIVQDADRLDAMGAVGIARAFSYGGFKNRRFYAIGQQPETYMTKESYKKSQGPTLHHFYEKLFKLKDKMNTDMGRQLAIGRHEFMELYLRTFYQELLTHDIETKSE